jgi:hypothetical protein
MTLTLVRHALRRLWRDRAVTAVALMVLALGIGANTALFTVVNAVLLRPLPYPAADRLVSLRLTDPAFHSLRVVPGERSPCADVARTMRLLRGGGSDRCGTDHADRHR